MKTLEFDIIHKDWNTILKCGKTLGEIYTMANELIYDHLNQWEDFREDWWELEWINSRRVYGQCVFGSKEIRLSLPFVQLASIEDIEDTILHEIAHALAGPDNGHNKVWKDICVKIGAKPERCSDVQLFEVKYNYKLECPNCDFTYYMYHKPKFEYTCHICDDKPNDKYLIRVTKLK